MGWDGIATLIGKLSTFLPGRIEQLKNEKERLNNERKILTSKIFSTSGSRRVTIIDARLRAIEGILSNKASD